MISGGVRERDRFWREVVLGAFGALMAAGMAAAQTDSATAQDAIDEDRSPSADYVLEIGDQIAIRVFNHPELEDTVPIRPDGKISLVLVDEIVAAGLTTRELDERLSESYSRFYRDVQLTVILRQFANQRVFVGGEVGQPGFVPLAGRLTALTAVLHSGGFRGTARTDSVILLRDGGQGQPQVVRLNLEDVLEGEKPDFDLAPFDVLYVPMSRIAKVDKFVDQYIRQLIPLSLTAGFTYIMGGSAVVLPAR
jgi:protein involved in polysaccharide export with SLBB domain